MILDPVTDIINCSLMTSTYPSMWKIAEVVPLHKEGDPEIASNNRPISLLSCLSKICDKVALNQYTEHLTNHRLLTEHQSGNRKKHSTETLNIAVTDMLLEHSLLHIEEDLHRIFEWCCNNSLLVNPEKTKMLVVGTRQLMNQLESPVHINFMGENLTPVTEVKDLGMLLDSHLTYDKHIQALSSSCISKLRQIGRVKHNFDQSTLATIIDTLVMSKINYCSTVWSNTSDGNIKKIQLIQNCAARLITGVPKYDHISPTLNALGWLSIKEHLLLYS